MAFVARGICTFAQKAPKKMRKAVAWQVQMAKAAGAKSIIVYDEKMSKAPLEQQNRCRSQRPFRVRQAEHGAAWCWFMIFC